jgi:recombinational DNA repair ATPase RecF
MLTKEGRPAEATDLRRLDGQLAQAGEELANVRADTVLAMRELGRVLEEIRW